MSSDPTEIWKTLPENPRYSISSLGRVIGPRSIVTPTIGERGYLRFSVTVNGKKKTCHLHQIVCRLFNGEAPKDKPFACHNNHVKTDCRASNLHWGSCQDNVDERQAAGRQHRRLTKEQVSEIRRRWDDGNGESQGSLGREFGVAPQYIGKLVRFKTWKE